MLAVGVLVAGVERRTHVAERAGVVGPEGAVELAEVRQRRQVFGDLLDSALVQGVVVSAGRVLGSVEIGGHPAQHVEQIVHARPGHPDREDQQHAVDRRLVDLDAEPVHQDLLAEVVSVHARLPQVQRDPRRVEHELVGPPRLVPLLQRALAHLAVGADRGEPEFVWHQI